LFSTPDVGTAKPVAVSYVLGNQTGLAGNYTLNGETLTADITAQVSVPVVAPQSTPAAISVTSLLASVARAGVLPPRNFYAVKVVNVSKGRASFKFPVHNIFAEHANKRLFARLSDGSPLPRWLVFDASKKLFYAKVLPVGAFPLEVFVSNGSKTVLIVLRSQQSL